MRLRQLARKLAVKPEEIVEFLALHHLSIEVESNTRLEDSQVALVMKQFAPAGEAVVDEVQEAELSFSENVAIEKELAPPPNESIAETQIEEFKAEVIKAPKIELSGLKVLGKIDLPEPKKKEQVTTQEKPGDQVVEPGKAEWKRPVEDRKYNSFKKEKKEQRNWKNPLAVEREREAREAEKKRRAEAEQAKQQRTQNYFKKVKASPPTKRAKLVEEPSMEMSDAELAETPRTWWGRLSKWLKA